jgi:hypothetical protein
MESGKVADSNVALWSRLSMADNIRSQEVIKDVQLTHVHGVPEMTVIKALFSSLSSVLSNTPYSS